MRKNDETNPQDQAAEIARLRALLDERDSTTEKEYATFEGDQPPIDKGGKRDEKWRHYTTIPDPEMNPDSPLHFYEAIASPTQPDKAMYRLESKNPIRTGDRRVFLYSCLVEDYEAKLREPTRQAAANLQSLGSSTEPAWNRKNKQEYVKIENVPLGETEGEVPGLVGISADSIQR